MKKHIRLLAILLAVLMLGSMFTGCAKKTASGSASGTTAASAGSASAASAQSSGSDDWDGNMDNLYTIDILADTSYVDSSLDTAIGQYIAQKFGIAFNYLTYSGDMQEKQALMLAGGDFNEMQYMQYQTIVQQYIDAGALLNLDDYKDLLPDFYTRFADLIPYWRAASKDGGLYKWESATPRTVDTEIPHFDIMVRSDVLEHYGWPNLVTASDWKAFLAKAVKDFPTSYDGQSTVGLTTPLAESWGMQGVAAIGYEKGDTYVAAGNDYYTYNDKTQQFEDYLLNPEAKESFQFFNDLYKEGLLDEECFTDTSDNTLAKMSDGRAIAVWYMSWNNSTANAALTEAGHPEMSYIQQPFQLDSQAGQKYTAPAIYSYPYMSYGVTTNCKHPERLLKFINWCCTEEGQLLLQSGIEGTHYTVENGKRVPTDLRYQCSSDEATAKKEGLMDGDVFPLRGLPMCFTLAEDGQPYNLSQDQTYIDEHGLSDREKEAFAGLGWKTSNQWWAENVEAIDPGYFQSCALDTTSDLGKVGAKMVELRVKYSANLLMADNFDDVWSQLMTEYDKLDHQKVIDAMNETLAGYVAAKNAASK
jgi:putative aldouronate transport system substrate-binding protein